MAKRKAGLHKRISSIFDGVPIPKGKDAQQPPYAPTPERTADEPRSEPEGERFVTTVPQEPPSPAPEISPTPELQPDEQQVHPLPQEYEPGLPSGKPPEPEPSDQPASSEPEAQPDEDEATFSPAEHEPPEAKPSDQPAYSEAEARLSSGKPKPDEDQVRPAPKAAPSRLPKVGATTKAIGSGPLGGIKNKLFAAKPGVDQKRQKVMALLVPLLAVILIVVFVKVVIPPSSAVARREQGKKSVPVTDSGDGIDWEIPSPYPATFRDAMRFVPRTTVRAEPGTAEPDERQTETIVVNSILHSLDRPSAAIGDRILHEGDKVAGATIIKIGKDSVEFERNGQRWTQKVHRQENSIP